MLLRQWTWVEGLSYENRALSEVAVQTLYHASAGVSANDRDFR